MSAGWRALTPSDLPDLVAIAGLVHPSLPEEAGVLEEKCRLYPPGCLLLLEGRRPAGYLLSHPWRRLEPPALDARLHRLPDTPDTLYVHDLALLPEARGRGAGREVVDRLLAIARAEALDNLSLVAVGRSDPFWRGAGFRPVSAPGLSQKLATYGGGATYMERSTA